MPVQLMTPTKFYSQSGEDALLWSLFGSQRTGFFIDIGAFDGVYCSNSFSFEQQGWTGVCVEANLTYARACARNRPGSGCVHAAGIAQEDVDEVEFLQEPLGLLSGIRADKTLNLDERYALRGLKFPGFQKVRVPASSLNRILQELLPAGATIDFLSIDTEGTELDVLRGINLARYPVRVLVVEANTPAAAKELEMYLAGVGYALARQIEPNLFFAKDRKDVAFLRNAIVECQTETTVHPLGLWATVPDHVGRTIRLIPPNHMSENVLRQQPGQPLYELLKPFLETGGPKMEPRHRFRFAHIVHTYACPPDSMADRTHQFTFGAIERARKFATDIADVDLISVHLAEDRDYPPSIFRKAAELTRTTMDIRNFVVPRKMPLHFDILEKGLAAAHDAEFVILTNADICPMPHFYELISTLLDLGFDTIAINRRVTGTFPLDARYRSLAEADYGGLHGGFDCFVFPTGFGTRMVRSDACVGAGWGMRSLLYNLVALSENMLILTDVHATYHIGDDSPEGNWNPEFADYIAFNQDNARAVLNTLVRDPVAARRLRHFCINNGEFIIP